VPKVDGFFSLVPRESDGLISLLYGTTNANFPRLNDFLGVSQITAPDEFFHWQPRRTFLPLVTAGLCTTPNYISINTSYQVNPNVEYTGAREGPNDQLNANVSKNFALVREMAFQMRIDAFNVFNHLQTFASGYDTSTSDGLFGIVRLGTSGNGNQTNRTIQISGRLTW